MRDAKKHHAMIAGNSYGAAVAPRLLGLQLVIARSFARIHWKNLVNFGVLPLTFVAPSDCDHLQQGDTIRISNLADAPPSQSWEAHSLLKSRKAVEKALMHLEDDGIGEPGIRCLCAKHNLSRR
jgi:aconitase A